MSTIVTRAGKGSALTHAEADANFTNLNTDKVDATGTATLTNKTISLTSNTITGTTAEFNTALSDGNFATLAGSETLTNKTIALGSNTVSGTIAQFNTAVTDADFATLAGTESLTNKTIGMAGALDCNNNVIQEIKTASFNGEGTLSTTTGTVNIDWTVAQNYIQNELTGAITYTMTNPPGPCHLQIRGLSDGTSTAYGITWDSSSPQKVYWYGSSFTTTTANKRWMINLWFDGTDYHAMGASEA